MIKYVLLALCCAVVALGALAAYKTEQASELKTDLEVVKEQVRVISSQNTMLHTRLSKISTETRIERTIINEMPVTPDEECVSDVLRKAVQ